MNPLEKTIPTYVAGSNPHLPYITLVVSPNKEDTVYIYGTNNKNIDAYANRDDHDGWFSRYVRRKYKPSNFYYWTRGSFDNAKKNWEENEAIQKIRDRINKFGF